MEIRLTHAEIAQVMRNYVAKRYNVEVDNGWAHKHMPDDEDYEKYGYISMSFTCTEKAIPKVTPDITPDTTTERKLDQDL